MFIARSLVFYPGYFDDNCQELSDEIILPSHTMNNLMERFDDGEMLYLNMTNIQINQSYLVAIGAAHTYDKNTIFAPQWILEQIGCTGVCDTVIQLTKADMSDVPPVTKIIIKPLDPLAFEVDTRECFEKMLMNLHSIKEGITIQFATAELGKDYKMYAYIDKVEPAAISRIVEGEVEVDFINEFKDTTTTAVVTESNAVPLPPRAASPLTDPPNPIIQPALPMLTAEERRQQIRDSWIRRYQNNGEGQ
jgi:hypothetical protein